MSDGKRPYEMRFGMPCNGLVTLGAMQDHPMSAKDILRLHQLKLSLTFEPRFINTNFKPILMEEVSRN